MSDAPRYDFAEIEKRWQQRWDDTRFYELDLDSVSPANKFYNLVEFPYPSAEGLHVGHVYTYSGADVYARYLRMRGRTVFQPIGFDSFGIHTENYALRAGQHPLELTRRTIANYRRQLRQVGVGWCWDQEVITSDPEYYRWTQWIFVKLFKAGLAERKEASVKWCPSCLTVLANEQLEGDRCERCGTVVVDRMMKQWFLRITSYADRLIDGLEHLQWPDVAKRLQGDWIGRSEGVEVDFALSDGARTLTAFTTRPDTLFGVTFIAVSPDLPDAQELAGRLVVNPASGDLVPIVIADYVLASYGSGIVMGVPAHDVRDHELALERGLPIRTVVEPSDGAPLPYTGEGRLVNSGPFTGLDSADARQKIADWLESDHFGRRASRYRLHDWLISRQRYWGPPIPIVYCPTCGPVPVPEDELPVLLPYIEEFRPTGTGLSPLAASEEFVATHCPQCGQPARRETDVSDTFLDSAWYFLRYPSAGIRERPWDAERTARMLPVDLYAGGREHVMRHHLYARFMTMALHDLGLVPIEEPFPRLLLHGLLIHEGAKMSKSRGNVVNPDEYVARYGADNLRMYLLFCGDWQEGGDFSDAALMGIVRFTRRLWRLFTSPHEPGTGEIDMTVLDRATAAIESDIEKFKFNTAIAQLMELVQRLGALQADMSVEQRAVAWRRFALLLAPFAPYLAEELWARLGGPFSVHEQSWPAFRQISDGIVTLVVQVNGRMRGRGDVPVGFTEQEALRFALSLPSVTAHLGPDRPRRVVYVPDKLINLVV